MNKDYYAKLNIDKNTALISLAVATSFVFLLMIISYTLIGGSYLLAGLILPGTILAGVFSVILIPLFLLMPEWFGVLLLLLTLITFNFVCNMTIYTVIFYLPIKAIRTRIEKKKN